MYLARRFSGARLISALQAETERDVLKSAHRHIDRGGRVVIKAGDEKYALGELNRCRASAGYPVCKVRADRGCGVAAEAA